VKAERKDLKGYLSVIPDPRIERCKKHPLVDIVMIALCGVIAGADTWQEVVDFGNDQRDWLSGFLELPHGIPSHDTFSRVFALLDTQRLNACFLEWTSGIREKIFREIVAIDGKTARRSHQANKGIKALHQVSAWAQENSMVLGQIKTEEKSNEIKAIPELLRGLNVKGCIVTTDAMGCQAEILVGAEGRMEGGVQHWMCGSQAYYAWAGDRGTTVLFEFLVGGCAGICASSARTLERREFTALGAGCGISRGRKPHTRWQFASKFFHLPSYGAQSTQVG
jgi:predicted transposase YbfD/YdcC